MSRLTRKISSRRPPHSLLIFGLACLLAGYADAQTKVLCRQGITGTTECGSPLALSYIPQLPALKIEGAAVGRLLVDTGSQGDWLAPGIAGRALISNGPGLLPSYQPFPSFPASQILGGSPGRIFIDNGTTGAWLGEGAAGYVLTANGPGVPASWQAVPTATTVSTILATSSFNLTGTFANIGLTLVLPTAGHWGIRCNVRMQLQASAGTGSLTIRLHNGAAAITNSERISPYSPAGAFTGATVPLDMVVFQAGPSTYDVQGNTTAGATYSVAQVLRDGSGTTYCYAGYLG